MRRLKAMCEIELARNLSLDNVCDVMGLAREVQYYNIYIYINIYSSAVCDVMGLAREV